MKLLPRRDGRCMAWSFCFVLVCLSFAGGLSQSSGNSPTTASGTGSTSSTTPQTTAPVLDATPPPDTTTPSTTTTTSPITTTTAPPTTTTTAPPPTTTTTAPRTTTATPTTTTTAPPTTTSTPTTTATPSTATPTSTTTASPATTTATPPTVTSPATPTPAPVVDQYNSSTLPPGVDSSMLDGAELVTVEVTETTAADGTTSYSYVIITKTGDTEQAITWQPETTGSTSRSAASGASSATQPGSALSDANTSGSSSALGTGALVGIIAGAAVFIVVLLAFFIAQRRRSKRRLSDADSVDFLESPVVGKQTRLLGNGQSPADTEYEEYSRTVAANSRSSGGSMPDGRRHRSTLWEDSVIVAARIPIDRIELGAVLNRGGFGEVYRGRYRNQDVAIKVLLPEKRKDLKYIEAFLAEVRLMATMDHPQIVQFIGVAWESLSDLYCVTEFMAGGDLRSLLKDYLANGVPQGMDASKVQIAYQVAYALTYLHSLNPVVLHRDLKSRNILLTTSLDAKLTDFGASRIRSDATMTAGVGSSLWMAPEVMMGKRYDEKADVFSLGVVLSELDTHELPYSHAKENSSDSGRPLPDTAVLQMVSLGKLGVRFSPFMDPDMVRFAKTCVSVDPTERPTAAEVLYYLQVAAKSHHHY